MDISVRAEGQPGTAYERRQVIIGQVCCIGCGVVILHDYYCTWLLTRKQIVD